MSNALVDAYRKDLASRGLVDPRPDNYVVLDLGKAAEQDNRDLFDQYPDFAEQYRAIREANAPSLYGEAGRALKAGTQELAATALGAGALVTGSDYLKDKARSFQADAAENAPTIPTMQDIGGAKDAVRYGISKVAGSVPSLVEGVGLAAGGAALGSAIGPEGTAAGAIEGGLEGFLGKGIVKNAIRRLLANEVIPGTEASVAAAIQAGDKTLLDAVAREASGIAARRAGTAANALNMYAQNAGALYNETDDRTLAAVGGAAGALPAIALPEIVIHKLYPGVAKKVGEQLGGQYVTRLATEALKDAGVLGSAMALQETTNLVAKNIAAGKEPTDFTDADWTRIKEAAIGGALTGPLASPLTARGNSDVFNPAKPKTAAEAQRNALAEKMGVSIPAETPSAPAATEPPPAVPPARRVALMTDEQKAARMADLQARQAVLTADEQQEMTLLQAFVPPAAAAKLSETPSALPTPDEVKPTLPAAPDIVPEQAAEILPVAAGETGTASGTEPPAAVTPVATGAPESPQILEPVRVGAPEVPPISPEPARVAESPLLGSGDSPAPAPESTWRGTVREVPKPASWGGKPGEKLYIPVDSSGNDVSVGGKPILGATPEEAIELASRNVVAKPPAPAVVPPSVPESPSLETRLREELAKPPAFSAGKINEAKGTIDLRNDPRFENLTPEQAAKLPVEGAIDAGGNRSKTRVAVVLEAPDGHYVKAGLLVPQEMATVGGGGERDTGPAVQSFSRITGKGENTTKLLKEGGNRPALLSDVVAAGYKIRAIVHFDEAPGSIFQRFDSRDIYDASYRASPKTTGTTAAKTAPTLSAAEGIERKRVVLERDAIQRKIDTLGAEMANADPARAAEITDEINKHYAKLNKLPEIRLSRADVGSGDSGLRFSEAAPTDYSARDLAALAAYERTLNDQHYGGRDAPPIEIRPRIPVSHLLEETTSLRGGFERALGRKIVFYEDATGRSPVAAGDRGGSGAIFVNVGSANWLAALLGHEWTHTIARTESYAKLERSLLELAPMPDSYRKQRLGEGYKPDQLGEEWIADLVGQRWHEPEFWNELRNTAQQRGMLGQFQELARHALTWINTVVAKLRGTLAKEVEASELANIEQIRRTIADAIVGRETPKEDPRLMTAEVKPTPLAIESDRTNQFTTATARLRQAGAKTELFSRAFLQVSVGDELGRRIETLTDRYMAATPDKQPAIRNEIHRLQDQFDAIEKVRGVAYSPWHIAVGLDDVQQQNLADLVALLHEGGHAILGRDPAMRGRVLRAVDGTFAEMQAKLAALQERTGVREVINRDPEELLVSTLAQKFAAEGIPDSPSLARAVMQWVKDLYYRVAMGIQASFGREPDPKLALDWFENQMRRVVGGDYDYRFASVFDRLQPEAPSQEVVRLNRSGGTPAEVSDFYDPHSERLLQPEALADTREALTWNLRLMTEEEERAAKELDIPAPEARARRMAAAISEVNDFVKRAYDDLVPPATAEGAERMPFEEFWTLVGKGDAPEALLADLEQKFPGSATAKIGGEGMTTPMNERARVELKKIIYAMQRAVVTRDATKEETSTRAEAKLVDAAKKLTKIEGDLRNADMHRAMLGDSLKEMIGGMRKGLRRGLDTAFAAGELAAAVREVEGLAERDAIPKEYQRVFKAVFADEIPVFDYMEAIAKLDMPLHEMTRAEILSGIEDNAAGDPALTRLLEPKNKPLLVALTALAKKEAQQMDLIQMRAIKDPAAYLVLKAKLDEIRNATPAQLTELERTFSAATKATTFADRIQRNAVKERARLRRAQKTIQENEASRELLGKMKAAIATKIDDIETSGMPAPSEWQAFSGEKYLAMNQGTDGTWRSTERPLGWNPDGTAVNGSELLTDLARNDAYLKANAKKVGSKTYEMVKRQWQELAMVDVLRKTPDIKRTWLEKFFLPSTKLLVSGGGAGAARVEQRMNRFQFLTDIKYWRSQFEISSVEWSNQLERAARAAGMKDTKAFLENVVEPVRYFIQAEEGREEGPVLREAVRAARRRLTTEVKPEFDEALKGLLRMDKVESEKFRRFADENGVYVQDERLGELRKAVGRGLFTLPRSMRAATVSTILRDMENAGWKMVFKDAKTDAQAVKGLDQGVSGGERVVGAASFDNLLPENAANEADAKARAEVMENPDAFAKAIGGFFSPGIVQRWLEPFINKPGEPVFHHGSEAIDPLDVQQAWQEAGGNVAEWIDKLGERVGLARDIAMDEDGATLELGDLSLEAQWRVAMLKRLDALFLMESRVAADANQTKGLFDATARPAHLIMDARENELLPPEHVQHAAFDHASSRNLLATLAFHAAFGRNGEGINRDIAEIQTNLRARKQAYEDIVAHAANKEDQISMAKDAGYDFKELKRAASIYSTVSQGIAAIKAQFGFNSSATMLADVRGGLELLHFIASQTTNNPKTGLLNMLQPAQRAIARGSIGPATIRDTTSAYGTSARTFFGSALEAFGLHLMHASRYASVIGATQGQAMGKAPASIIFGMRAGARGETLPKASQAMRVISAAQKRGRLGLGEVREFPALQAIPLVNQVMHGIGLNFGISNGTAESRAIEGLVHAAMQHFAANPDHLNDPTFILTHADIAAQDRTLAMDKKSFEYLRRKMVEYNIGPLERVTRDAIDRATRAEPILTDDQTLKALQISLNDIDLVSSINTNPATWDTNRGLRLITPLLGWPIRQMNSINEAMRTERGFEPTFAQFKQAAKTVGILAGWSLPVGLAFTMLTDLYDEKILKKKTNLGRLSALDLVPGGALVGLATSDIPLKEHLTAIAQRLSRAGNIYGLGFDAFATTLAGADPTSGQRPFSMDGRILAFSQLMNLRDAMSNWYNSGFATTYANFERPLIQALAGSGPLQAMDIFGNLMGIDNQEMRIAQRTNTSQWLRAAGREAGVEIKRSGGGSVAPTPMSVWTREMYLAALGNDRLDFMDAYRRAVDAAREESPDNPEAKVLESWRSRNPLEVFRTKPDEAKMSRMLATMTDSGREAVSDTLRLYQQYSDLIAVSPAERYEHRLLSQQSRGQNMNSLRARMAGGALQFR